MLGISARDTAPNACQGRVAKGSFRSARIAAALALLVAGACSDAHVRFPTSASEQKNLPENVQVIVLDPTNINSFTQPARGHIASGLPAGRQWSYRVGPGDVLSVIVFNHPELTLPAGPDRTAEAGGFQVSSDGSFAYPYIGSVTAAGKSLEDIRADIAARLATFIPDPQVDVRVAAFNSQSVVVSGEIETPNRQPLTTVPLTLIEAINAAGGFTDAADPREVSVQRGGQMYRVDVEGFLAAGMTGNNPVLRNGDVINVPRRKAEEAYLLGEVARPDVVDLSRERITLTQAIARRGGLQQPRADARGVLVFRANGDMYRVFQLDVSEATGLLLGTRFVLEPGDVVYVLRSPLQRWNDSISRLLPTVQAINTVDDLGN